MLQTPLNSGTDEEEYLNKIRERIDILENDLVILDEKIKEKEVNLNSKKKLFKEEFSIIEKEIEETNKIFQDIVNNIMNMILKFKISGRIAELDRLTRKIENWNPGEKITRKQFLLMLQNRVKEDEDNG